MFVASVLVLGLCYFHQASGATHSLQYFYTATSGISDFPEFVAVGMMDNAQFVHYDSNSKKAVPKQDWIDKNEGPQYWERETGSFLGASQSFKANIETVKQRFNQTGGVHSTQRMYGCQWDDETGAVDGFSEYGYDGEDWLSLDLKNLRYISAKPQSFITKQNWEKDGAFMASRKPYFTQQCIDYLKKYVQYGRSSLERKVRPVVNLLQKDSRVVCHATGFFPDGVMITLKRDGVEIHEDVDLGETLPNDDGTFQKRAVLTVSPEELKNMQYTCEVAHKSGDIIILGEADIKSSNPDSFPLGAIIGVVVFALIVLIGIAAAFVVLKKKKKAGFTRASTDESSQSSSEKA